MYRTKFVKIFVKIELKIICEQCKFYSDKKLQNLEAFLPGANCEQAMNIPKISLIFHLHYNARFRLQLRLVKLIAYACKFVISPQSRNHAYHTCSTFSLIEPTKSHRPRSNPTIPHLEIRPPPELGFQYRANPVMNLIFKNT